MRFFRKSADQKTIKGLMKRLFTEKSSPVIHVVTENYEKMKQFFIDLGLHVDKLDEGLQFTPYFNQGLGTAIYLSDMTICLEEATHTEPSGAIYLDMGEISEDQLNNVAKKYKIRKVPELFTKSSTYFITPPDGGFITATKSEQ